MATEAQINANRQNAQHSTGPRTEEGKARSSMNHLSHGLRARHVVLDYEDRAEFDKMCARLEREWQPATLSEEMMLEQIVTAEWNLACFQAAANQVQMDMPSEDQPKCLDRLDLYRRRFENSLMRAHIMLLKLRKERNAPPVEVTNPVQPQEAQASKASPMASEASQKASEASKVNPAPCPPGDNPPSGQRSEPSDITRIPAPASEVSEASQASPRDSAPPRDPKKVWL